MSKFYNTLNGLVNEKYGGWSSYFRRRGPGLFYIFGLAALGIGVVAQDWQARGLRADIVRIEMKINQMQATSAWAPSQVPTRQPTSSSSISRITPLKAVASKGPLNMPMNGFRLVTKYGWNQDMSTGDWSYANKVVFSSPSESPVMSAQYGRVLEVIKDASGAVAVEIDHGGSRKVYYGRLSRVNIKSGDEIDSGEILGRAKNLELGLNINGSWVDPMTIIGQSTQ